MDEPDKLDSFLGLEAAGDFVDSFFEADDDDKRLIFTLEEEEGVLLDPESEELDQGEQKDSQESQNLLGSDDD